VERLGRMELGLEVVVEDASDEVYSFQIQKSLIYWKFGGLYIIKSHCIRNPSQGGIISVKSYHAQPHQETLGES